MAKVEYDEEKRIEELIEEGCDYHEAEELVAVESFVHGLRDNPDELLKYVNRNGIDHRDVKHEPASSMIIKGGSARARLLRITQEKNISEFACFMTSAAMSTAGIPSEIIADILSDRTDDTIMQMRRIVCDNCSVPLEYVSKWFGEVQSA